jgi:hypothetical protein
VAAHLQTITAHNERTSRSTVSPSAGDMPFKVGLRDSGCHSQQQQELASSSPQSGQEQQHSFAPPLQKRDAAIYHDQKQYEQAVTWLCHLEGFNAASHLQGAAASLLGTAFVPQTTAAALAAAGLRFSFQQVVEACARPVPGAWVWINAGAVPDAPELARLMLLDARLVSATVKVYTPPYTLWLLHMSRESCKWRHGSDTSESVLAVAPIPSTCVNSKHEQALPSHRAPCSPLSSFGCWMLPVSDMHTLALWLWLRCSGCTSRD